MKNSEKILGTSWQFSWSYTRNLRPNNSTPRYIPKRNETICSQKNLYVNIYNRCIHNRKSLEITQYPSIVIPLCHGISSVQSLFAMPWTEAHQASLFITNCQSPPKPMSIELVMPSNHLILCRPLLFLPSIFPSIRVFSCQVAKVLEFQLQHQSFQWTPRTDLL